VCSVSAWRADIGRVRPQRRRVQRVRVRELVMGRGFLEGEFGEVCSEKGELLLAFKFQERLL
jgi:hypothetical protein